MSSKECCLDGRTIFLEIKRQLLAPWRYRLSSIAINSRFVGKREAIPKTLPTKSVARPSELSLRSSLPLGRAIHRLRTPKRPNPRLLWSFVVLLTKNPHKIRDFCCFSTGGGINISPQLRIKPNSKEEDSWHQA